jgi:hypothetical protein
MNVLTLYKRPPHLYVCADKASGVTRCWTPCLDRSSECGTWEMVFDVPAEIDIDVEGQVFASVSVVCNGTLVEQASII